MAKECIGIPAGFRDNDNVYKGIYEFIVIHFYFLTQSSTAAESCQPKVPHTRTRRSHQDSNDEASKKQHCQSLGNVPTASQQPKLHERYSRSDLGLQVELQICSGSVSRGTWKGTERQECCSNDMMHCSLFKSFH